MQKKLLLLILASASIIMVALTMLPSPEGERPIQGVYKDIDDVVQMDPNCCILSEPFDMDTQVIDPNTTYLHIAVNSSWRPTRKATSWHDQLLDIFRDHGEGQIVIEMYTTQTWNETMYIQDKIKSSNPYQDLEIIFSHNQFDLKDVRNIKE